MQNSKKELSSADSFESSEISTSHLSHTSMNANIQSRRNSFCSWLGSSAGSIFFHLIILLIVVLVFRFGNSSGIQQGARQTDEVGIVFSDSQSVVKQDNDRLLSDSSSKLQTITEAESKESLKNVVEQLLPTNEIGLTSESNSYASVLGSNVDSHQLSGVTNGGGGQIVGFGDVKGSGKKFVYVLDRSDSMSWKGGAPMRRAIGDAVASLNSLDPQLGANKFQVIAYNHDVEIFEQNSNLINVSSNNKVRAIRFLRSLVPTGGTNPEHALEQALKMRPDVVFFLTDADEELTAYTLAQIQSLRRQYKVKQICVIEFGKASAPKKRTFRQLAGENNGTYVFKNIEAM